MTRKNVTGWKNRNLYLIPVSQRDHVHMIMVIPPKYSISDVMRDLKSQSTVCLRNKFSWLKDVYWKENIFWSPGFFVSSVGIDEEVIRKYIEHQGKEGSGQIELDL